MTATTVNQPARFWSAATQPSVDTIFRNAFSHAQQTQPITLLSIDNAPNEACGDLLDPDFSGLYVWSNNVNTLSLNNGLADLHELCHILKAKNIGIAALQEINIDLSQASVYQRVKAVFDSHFDSQCTLVCSTTHIRSSTDWKPGSTMLFVLPTWTPYIVSRSRDDLGWWCSVTLEVKAQRQLGFYSFYNCCKTQIEQAGIHMIFAQQWHVLRQRGDPAPDPRLQAINDLSAELAVHTQHQRSILGVGDCKEDTGGDPALMANICTTHSLVDVMDILHPDASHISSYARGSTRLDYTLISQDLLPHLTGAGLNHYHDFYPSDHRPIFVALHASLFGPTPAFASHRSRFVHSNSKMVATFVTLAHQHLCDTVTFGQKEMQKASARTLVRRCAFCKPPCQVLAPEMRCHSKLLRCHYHPG
jgi:hypothetical protein